MKHSKTPLGRIKQRSVLDEKGCWRWTGTINHGGYGKLFFNGRQILAHRFSYETCIGPVPEGLFLDHLCRVRDCVNPEHLEAVTLAENTRRGESGKHLSSRTHCPQGHEYTESNIWWYEGRRYCRTCRRERRAAQAVAQAEKAQRSNYAVHSESAA